MKLAVISDIHTCDTPGVGNPQRRGDLGLPLLKRAVARLARFVKPELTVVLGDLVDDGTTPGTRDRFLATKAILETLGTPYLVLPGNHDGDGRAFDAVFGTPAPTRDVAGVRFVSFRDAGVPGWNATRSDADLARSRHASDGWSGPVVALQHVPLFPPGSADCPYCLTNAEEAIAALRQGGGVLALAGHAHAGMPLAQRGELHCAVAPALCEAPFQFLVIEIADGVPPRAEMHPLALPTGLELCESHLHTQFAYCADDISIDAAIELCALLGVRRPAFAEHSGQLYFDADTFWRARFMETGVRHAQGRQRRMELYFEALAAAGIPPARRGLEVDCDFHGDPVIEDRDRARAGFLLGAVHWTRMSAAREPFDADVLAQQHLRAWSRFLSCGIDVLAHPFRVFSRNGGLPPDYLLAPLADLLAARGVAAEMNFHTQTPIPAFVQICLEKGVRLSLGTDSHRLSEVAEFWPHLQLLDALGVARSELANVLWQPEA